MSNADKLHHGYIAGIDGLRAIAVLAVILFHFNPVLLPGGFAGVDVFFVISGYVVSASLARELPARLFEFTRRFYARRILRIYPALVTCIVLMSIVHVLIVPASWLSSTSTVSALFAFFGLSNFALVWFDDGYFSPRIEFNAFTHTWSLAVEEQFYLLFPFVFYIWHGSKGRDDLRGCISKYILAILLVLSLIYSWFETSAMPERAYYLLPSRFWELACGAMLFKFYAQRKRALYSPLVSSLSILLGLILLIFGLIYANPKIFPFPWALPAVLGSVLIIYGLVSAQGHKLLLTHFFDNKIMVYIGKISYSLYLWHWPVLVMFRWTCGLDGFIKNIAALFVILTCSFISYHFVEMPIKQNWFIKSKKEAYIVSRGLVLIILCTVFTGLLFKGQRFISISVTKEMRTWYPYPWPSSQPKAIGLMDKFDQHKLFVLGDSHTDAYRTLFRQLADEYALEVLPYSAGGCAVANLLEPATPNCALFIQKTLLEIEKVALPGDIVFLASLRMNRLGNQYYAFNESEVINQQNSLEAARGRLLAFNEAEAIIARLEKLSVKVLIDAPKPIFRSPAFRCSDWFNAGNSVCSGGLSIRRDFLLEHRKPIMQALNSLAKKHPYLYIWDPFPILCPDDLCVVFDGKKPLFFDGDHLSAHGNRVLFPAFHFKLRQIWSVKEGRIEGD
jgi:peptidoglycan/LPS O-acetylase OafA/YrhL